MKKLFAVIMAAAMIATMFVFTANAADNEWSVYASANRYKESYEEDESLPRVPGMRYTENGVQMYTATSEELEAMSANAWGTIQTTNKVSYKNGVTMTVLADAFTDNASTDKWISFTIWDSQKTAQGAAGYGCGWLCLIRPNAGGCDLQSFMCTPTVALQQLILTNASVDIYEGEALTLEIKPEDGKFNVYVNGVDMKASAFTQFMENDEAYIGVTGHQGCREQMMLTVTELNGEKPTGTDNVEPYVDPNAKKRPDEEHTPAVPEGEPCWLWNFESVKNGKPGEGMKSEVNDDGSLKITFDENAPMINETIKTGSYKAEEFPYFAVLYKNLDELGSAVGSLWYCAGEVVSAQNDSHTGAEWGSGDYDMDNDNGWRLLVIDLTEETTWEGYINSFRLDIAGDGSLAGETADLMWIGFFRSEKDAYTYAKMGEYYAKEYEAAPTTTVTEAEATKDVEPASSDTGAESTAPEGSSTDKTTDTEKTDDTTKKSNTGAIVGIIIAAVVVVAAVVCGIVLGKKKKK